MKTEDIKKYLEELLTNGRIVISDVNQINLYNSYKEFLNQFHLIVVEGESIVIVQDPKTSIDIFFTNTKHLLQEFPKDYLPNNWTLDSLEEKLCKYIETICEVKWFEQICKNMKVIFSSFWEEEAFNKSELCSYTDYHKFRNSIKAGDASYYPKESLTFLSQLWKYAKTNLMPNKISEKELRILLSPKTNYFAIIAKKSSN